jgi:hypothetical protein
MKPVALRRTKPAPLTTDRCAPSQAVIQRRLLLAAPSVADAMLRGGSDASPLGELSRWIRPFSVWRRP